MKYVHFVQAIEYSRMGNEIVTYPNIRVPLPVQSEVKFLIFSCLDLESNC